MNPKPERCEAPTSSAPSPRPDSAVVREHIEILKELRAPESVIRAAERVASETSKG